MYEYKATILRVVDGDTVDVDIDLGFGVWLRKERVRIMGIDTPESRTRDKEEKRFGLAAKNRLKELLPVASIAILKTQIDRDGEDAKGKFGRILGNFLPGDSPITPCSTMVTEILIKEGHAVAYHGQNKDDVAKAHLKNRERLIAEGKV
jgi:micrococcal nuclease